MPSTVQGCRKEFGKGGTEGEQRGNRGAAMFTTNGMQRNYLLPAVHLFPLFHSFSLHKKL